MRAGLLRGYSVLATVPHSPASSGSSAGDFTGVNAGSVEERPCEFGTTRPDQLLGRALLLNPLPQRTEPRVSLART